MDGYDFSKEGVAFIVKGQVGCLEDEGNTFLRKVGNHSPYGAPARPRRTESSCSQILPTQNLKIVVYKSSEIVIH